MENELRELENELNKAKVEIYDSSVAFKAFQDKMFAITTYLQEKIDNLKNNTAAIEQQDEAVVENAVEQEPAVEENAPVIVPDGQQDAAVITPIGDNTEVSSEPAVVGTDVPVQETATEPVNEGLPLIQPAVENATDIPSTPTLNDIPLTPNVGVQGNETSVQEKKGDNKIVIVKTDSNPSKAIVVTPEQKGNSKKTEEFQKSMLGLTEANSPVIEVATVETVPTTEANPIVEIPTVEQPAVITPIGDNTGNNDLARMMQEQQKAYAAGDMQKAEAIGNQMMLIKRPENKVA